MATALILIALMCYVAACIEVYRRKRALDDTIARRLSSHRKPTDGVL